MSFKIVYSKNEAEVKLGRLQGVNDKHLAEKQVYEGELAALRKEVEAKEDNLEQVQKELKTLQAVSKILNRVVSS